MSRPFFPFTPLSCLIRLGIAELATASYTQLVWKVTKFFRNVLQIQSIPHDQEYLMNKNFWKSKYFIEPFFRISTIFILSNYCSKHTFNNPSVTFLWVKVSYFLYKIQAFSIETGHCTKVYNIHKKILNFWQFFAYYFKWRCLGF